MYYIFLTRKQKINKELPSDTYYISKGSYTLNFTQWKNFQSYTCLLFLWPISAPLIHCLFLAAFQDLFASVCSHPSGVPVTSLLFLAAFGLICLNHHLGSSHCSPFIFGGFLGHFGLVFSPLLAVPVTSHLSLPAFEVMLHLFVVITIYLVYNFNKYLWVQCYLLCFLY